MLLPYLQYRPAIEGSPQLGIRAAVIGRTSAGAGLVVRDYATLRADGESITLGERVFFGERACVHIWDSTRGTVLGDDVTIGRYALVHACTLGDGVVLAEGSVVMDAAEVGAYALIGPGALVPPRKKLPGGLVYEGNPAQPVREISRAELAQLAASVRAGTPLPAAAMQALPPLDNQTFLPAGATADGLHALNGKAPRINGGYVAETALIVGDVQLDPGCGIYFGCALKAGGGPVHIGARSNIQDSALLETRSGELVIASDVTVGHNVRMGSGRVAEESLIGMGAVVGDGVVVERGGCIGAGAWVEPNTVVKSGWIWAGRPARAFREIKPAEREGFATGRAVYVRYARGYLEQQKGTPER